MYDVDKLWLPPTGPDDMDGMPDAARQVALAGWQDYGKGCHRQVLEHDKWREWVHAYLACVSFVDDCIGQVLQALEQSRYAGNTIVVLCSDNGWALGEHFHWKKWSVFDSGSRVPLIVKAPGIAEGGTVCDAGVDLTDIYPTLVDVCGVPDPGHLDSVSLRPLLSGDAAGRDRPGLTSFGPNNHSLRTDRWRYTRYCDGSEELYDYENDAWEHRNLADDPAYGEIKESLSQWFPGDRAPAVASVPPPGGPLDPEPGENVWFRGIESGYAKRTVKISAVLRAEGDGVVVHHTGFFAGYALYVKNNKLCLGVAEVETPLRWDRLDQIRTVVEADTALPEGVVAVEGVWAADGSITLKVDDRIVGSGRANGPLPIYPTGLLEAGGYRQDKYPPIGDYGPIEEFPGSLRDLHIEFV